MAASFTTSLSLALPFLLLALSALTPAINAGDPDILTDFAVPPSLDPSMITRQYFTYTGLRQLRKANLTGRATALITKVSMKEFPALEGQSVSTAVLMFPVGGVNPPHIHPRGAELLLVLQGRLEVGFVDTKGKLFVQTVRSTDLFVFPKGMVHFQVNVGKYAAVAVGMFGSANAGTTEVGKAVFGSGISEEVLARSFKTDVGTVDKIVKGFMAK